MNNQLKCTIHSEEPLDLVCMSSNCEQKGLICYLCKVDGHAQHDPILSLKIFFGELFQKTTGNQQFIKETAQIDKEGSNIQQKLNKLKKKMITPELADQAFQNFWKEVVASIVGFDELLTDLKEILKNQGEQLIQELNRWIRTHGDKYSSQKDEQSKDNIYITFLKGKLEGLAIIREQLSKIQSKANFDDSQLLSLFVVQATTGSSNFKLRFSQELKGPCMSISSPTKASMTVHGNQRMILLQPHLGINRRVKKWRVKIEKLASWIGVGVAHLDSIKGVNFDFSYTSANHGNYLISSNGYSWNGYKMEFNSKYQTFQYTTGDVIEVTYDPNNNNISFKKDGNESVFTYDVDPNQKPIHAAINMTGVGDAVQIIH